jgi:ABC-type uncharacterized transport system involved in gliding motility auxiliary subunit
MSNNKNINDKKLFDWIVFGLVVLIILVFILVSRQIFFRLDLTEGQKYSISKPTVQLLSKLDNVLNIEYYYSNSCKDVKDMAQIVQYVEDILKEYENRGKGNVNVVIKELSYEKDAALVTDLLEQDKLQEFNLSESGKTQSKSLLGFSGIILTYNRDGKLDKKVIPAVYQDEGFEFRLDVEIRKLIGVSPETIGILFGMKGMSLDRDYVYVKQIIESEYDKVEIIDKGMMIPESVTILVVIGADNLDEWDVYQVDQFLVRGGSAFIMVNGTEIDFQSLQATPAFNPMLSMLDNYGFTVNHDFVGDNDSYLPMPDGNNMIQSKKRYPIWVRIKGENINKNSIAANKLESMNLFWVSSISLKDSVKDKAIPIFKTTKNSFSVNNNYQLDWRNYEIPIEENLKSYDLAFQYEGPIESYFKGKEIPKKEEGVDNIQKARFDDGKTKMIIVGSQYFLYKNFINNDEMIFMMNSLDLLSKDQSLISIRNKGKFSRPLTQYNTENEYNFKKNLIIAVSTYVLPVILLFVMVFIFLMRSIRNDKKKEEYLSSSKES